MIYVKYEFNCKISKKSLILLYIHENQKKTPLLLQNRYVLHKNDTNVNINVCGNESENETTSSQKNLVHVIELLWRLNIVSSPKLLPNIPYFKGLGGKGPSRPLKSIRFIIQFNLVSNNVKYNCQHVPLDAFPFSASLSVTDDPL